MSALLHGPLAWALSRYAAQVEAAKRGTPHEQHRGWLAGHDLHEQIVCSCGEPLDEALGLVQRLAEPRELLPGTPGPVPTFRYGRAARLVVEDHDGREHIVAVPRGHQVRVQVAAVDGSLETAFDHAGTRTAYGPHRAEVKITAYQVSHGPLLTITTGAEPARGPATECEGDR